MGDFELIAGQNLMIKFITSHLGWFTVSQLGPQLE